MLVGGWWVASRWLWVAGGGTVVARFIKARFLLCFECVKIIMKEGMDSRQTKSM